MRDLATEESTDQTVFDVDAMTTEQRLQAGRLIGQVIEARSLKRVDIAAAASVNRTTLRSLERGTRAPHPAILKRVIAALGLRQEVDVESGRAESSRLFLASVATLLEQLPEDSREEAQADVIALLAGKLSRLGGDTPAQASPNDLAAQQAADVKRMLKHLG